MDFLGIDALDRVIHVACEGSPPEPTSRVQTGIPSLDFSLGGGLASGIVEVVGGPSCGKTALVGQTMAHCQRGERHTVGLLPTEYLDLPYLENLGVSLPDLLLLNQAAAIPFLQEVEDAVLVIDSLSFLGPGGERHASFLYETVEELRAHLGPRQCVICTTHVRARRSATKPRGVSSGLESAHRRFVDMFDVRLEVSREQVKESSYTLVVNVLSNTLAAPGRYVKLHSVKGRGVDRFQDLVHAGCRLGVLERRGTFYSFGAVQLGQGISAAADCIRGNERLERAVMHAVAEGSGA